MAFHQDTESFQADDINILLYSSSLRPQESSATNFRPNFHHSWCKIPVTEECINTDALENVCFVVPVYTTEQKVER